MVTALHQLRCISDGGPEDARVIRCLLCNIGRPIERPYVDARTHTIRAPFHVHIAERLFSILCLLKKELLEESPRERYIP